MGFWQDLTGQSAAEASAKAAADTYAKQQAASDAARQAGTQYSSNLQGISGNFGRYEDAGGSALQQLLAGLGLGGQGGQEAFTSAYRGIPGYQAGLDTGTRAATSAANAGGMLQSGKTLKDLYRFGSDYEDQRSGQYFDRLAGLGNLGYQATGAKTGLQAQGFQGLLGAQTGAAGQDFQSSGTTGQGLVAGEQAKMQGLQGLLATGATGLGLAFGGGKLPSFGKLFG